MADAALKYTRYILVWLSIVILDISSKAIVHLALPKSAGVPVGDFLIVANVMHETGASGPLRIGYVVIGTLVIMAMWKKVESSGIGMIVTILCASSASNALEMAYYGAVTDWIAPLPLVFGKIFNLADCMIFASLLMLYGQLISRGSRYLISKLTTNASTTAEIPASSGQGSAGQDAG